MNAEQHTDGTKNREQDSPVPCLSMKKGAAVMKSLCLIIPCYNEEKVLPVTGPLFLQKLKTLIEQGRVSPQSRILFVDDGSTDETWTIIRGFACSDPCAEGIALSRNRGHQNALLAGLTEASGRFDWTVSLDCDGQDDLDAVDRMLDAAEAGSDVVYAVRSDRSCDSGFKRFTAQTYYRILSRSGAEIVYNHADYRLLSRRALTELLKYEEVNLFLRGLVPLVGFPSTTVEYVRNERKSGKTHYPLGKMLDLALNGITGFSTKPLRQIMLAGLLFAAAGFICFVTMLILKLCGTVAEPLWLLLSALFFFCGLQLFAAGLVGEYVGKTLLEAKHRPRFTIRERTGTTEGPQE